MQTHRITEPNLDRFEGEGGALAGRSELRREKALPDATPVLNITGKAASWHVRPVFLAELDALLKALDVVDSERRTSENIASDADEEFVQNFQEKLDEQVLPHLWSVADLLSKRYYPVEVRVVGEPRERTCFLAVSKTKQPGNWARHGESITGRRMTFSAHLPSREVVYTANYRDGLPRTVHMHLSKITDSFIEQELRELVGTLREERKNAPTDTRALDDRPS
jgi:hypothetical protein